MNHFIRSLTRAGVMMGALVVVSAGARCTPSHSAIVAANLTPSAGPLMSGTTHAAALDSVLHRACGDCHSSDPLQAPLGRVPPFSWLMARGARQGRQAVDFTRWSGYPPQQQRRLLLVSCADAKSGRMPVASYVRLWPEAKLSGRDVETICGAAR